MVAREILVTRKRFGDMAKIAGDMARQLDEMQLELEALMNEFPAHTEEASRPLVESIHHLREFARAIAL